ncbi:hypothetical protein KO465_02170 [Candidatus Micrarchaeota archaeon]|nr:hypothetical protein [Candidatus Micrarchaeota archaeon]
MPIVIIHDCKEGKANDTADKLADLFKKDGYNAAARPFKSMQTGCNTAATGILKSPNELKQLYTVYDPDVIIIATNDLNSMEELEKSFEIDIEVLYKYSGMNTVSEGHPCGRDIKLIVVSDNTEYSMSEEAKMKKDTDRRVIISRWHICICTPSEYSRILF